MCHVRREDCLIGEEQFNKYFGPMGSHRPKEPTSSRTRKEQKPNKYDGKTTFHLFASCTGDALSELTINEIQIDRMTYQELVDEMTKEFGPRECAESYYLELSRREQRPGETLYKLGQDIRRLTQRAYPKTNKEKRDRLATECFKKAVADPEVRKDLFRIRPATLNEAITAATEIESYYNTEKDRGRNKSAIYTRPTGVPISDLDRKYIRRIEAIEDKVNRTLEQIKRCING